MFRMFTNVVAAVCLSSMLLPATAFALTIDSIGGDDVILTDGAGYRSSLAAMSDDGDVYVAVQRYDSPGTGYSIEIHRSQDMGDTWTLWGSISDALATTGHFLHRIYIPRGPNALCFVLYAHSGGGISSQLKMARASLDDASANFAYSSIFDDPSINFSTADMDSDSTDYDDYWLYVVCSANDGNGRDIWFTRSRSMGEGWEAGYRIAISDGAGYDMHSPRISYGFDNRLHAVWVEKEWPEVSDMAVRYRRALDHANADLAAWQTTVEMTTHGSGYHEDEPAVRASRDSDEVLLSYSRRNAITSSLQTSPVHVSTTGGATWTQQIQLSYWPNGDILEMAPTDGWALVIPTTSGGHVVRASSGDNPLLWQPADFYTDYHYASFQSRPGCAQLSSAPEQMAWVWTVDSGTGPDPVYFDASWRAGPGYPNLEQGYPVRIDVAPETAPAVVDLDSDDDLEIVWGDSAGMVQVFEHDATSRAGWPVDIGDIPENSPVAIGDLRGGGAPWLVAGNYTGQVYVFDADGVVQPGWPVDLGTSSPVYVSIGALAPPYARYVVACSSNKMWVLNYAGIVRVGFPFVYGDFFSAPAAIGDVDGNGSGELVSVKGSWLHVNETGTPTPKAWRNFSPKTFAQPPSLGDLDLDGDLEIVVATEQGDVYVLHNDTSDYAPWPYSDPGGEPTTAVAIANTVGTVNLDLAFAQKNGVVHHFYDYGLEVAGWPHTTTPGWWLYGAPILELTDDDSPDVVIGSRDQFGYSWNNLLTGVQGWPKDLQGQCELSPAGGDVDDDGHRELVFLTLSHLVLLDVGPPGTLHQTEDHRWPMFMHDPQRTSCADCPENLVTAGPEAPSITQIGLRVSSRLPAAGAISMKVALPERAEVELNVYDVRGRIVSRLLEGVQEPGEHTAIWDGSDHRGRSMANGVYFARLSVVSQTASEHLTRKLMLLR